MNKSLQIKGLVVITNAGGRKNYIYIHKDTHV